ncbi:hypothetical protein [uncultured Roseibium sp.]|uniref:hypothetical protein n=1 Tax=uncultured Roseibium sp. TaxID=1936171 RepID=UPI002630C1B6|nr:hypothetical protein [uncultured Roseibium sp.]
MDAINLVETAVAGGDTPINSDTLGKYSPDHNDAMENVTNAINYQSRKDIHPGRASSLKKIRRSDEIALGKRPVNCIPKPKKTFVNTHTEERLVTLHPTKGYRSERPV